MALSVTVYIIVFLIVVILGSLVWGKKRGCALPGPTGWPLVGIYPNIPNEFYKYLAEQAKKYGDIFYCRFGLTDLIVINSVEVADELYRKRGGTFNNRFMDLPEEWDVPIGFAELNVNNKWQELRAFTMKSLNTNNFGDRTLEDVINEEFSHFSHRITNSYDSKPCTPFRTVTHSIANILFGILFKKRKDYDDTEMADLLRDAHSVTQAVNPLTYFVVPSFIHLLGRFNFIPMKSTRRSQESIENILSTSDAEITNHLNERKEGKEGSGHFIDMFLSERDEKLAKGDHTFHSVNSLKGVISNMFVGGIDSTALTVNWMMVLLVKHQDIQMKLRKEVEDFTSGDGSLPTLDNKARMNYASAFIHEVHRFISPGPLVPTHAVAEDTEYQGKFIPKGTYVTVNAWRIHHNENIFSDPFTFKPERFIDENGIFQPSSHCVHFGLGKRACVGKIMATRVLFLFLTNLVKKFSLQLPDGVNPDTISTEGHFNGIAIQPPSLEFRLIPITDAPGVQNGVSR